MVRKAQVIQKGVEPYDETLKKVAGVSHPTDLHVGERVRLRRTLVGISQEKLGVAIGITFQQIQKYERGLNRIGASRLWAISKALDIDISFFFEGLSHSGSIVVVDPMLENDTLRLMRDIKRLHPAVIDAIEKLVAASIESTKAKPRQAAQ